jgi:predicted transcriptional regulator
MLQKGPPTSGPFPFARRHWSQAAVALNASPELESSMWAEGFTFERTPMMRTNFGAQQLIVFIERSRHSGDAMKTKVFFDGFEGHVRRSLDRARRRDKGERLEAQRVITFEDPLMMIECLTVQRIRLCQVVRKKRLSISALAEELGRNRGSVTRDVNKLKKLGLLRLREEVNPGHGVVQIVEPAAQKFEMRIAL